MNQIGKFLIQNPAPGGSYAASFVIQPNITEEKLLGKLFVLTGIDKPRESDVKIFNSVFDFIRDHYYNFHLTDYSSEKFDFESLFENILQKANLELYQKFEKKDWDERIKKINTVVGVIKGDKICFVQYGHCQVFLIAKNKIAEIASPKKENFFSSRDVRVFSYLTSGFVKQGEKLLICTGNISSLLPPEKIKDIVASSSPTEASARLKHSLSGLDKNISASALVIEALPLAENKTVPRNELIRSVFTPDASGEINPQLRQKTPHPAPSIPKKFKSLFKSSSDKPPFEKEGESKGEFKEKIQEKPEEKPQEKTFVFKPAADKFFSLILLLFQKLFAFTAKAIEKIFQAIFHLLSKVVGRFNKLPAKSKVLLVVSLILAISFFQTTLLIISKQKNDALAKKYNDLVKSIENLQTSGAAALIYNDKESAGQSFREAENLLKELPKDSAEQQQKFDALTKENKEKLNALYHLISIDEPAVLTDLTAQNPPVQAKGILNSKENLYFFNEHSVYQFNPTAKEIDKLNQTDYDNLKFALPLGDGSVLFCQADGRLIQYSLKNKAFSDLKLTSEKNFGNIKDAAIYGEKLYLLNPIDNQILKYAKSPAGFGSETSWIKDSATDIKDAVSFAIDSAIYILKADGQVVKFYQGAKQNFNLDKIEPPLAGSNKIFTALGLKYLYILDSAGKRLVIAGKDGKLQKQFYSEKFGELQDFAVNEKAGKIYLLNENAIFEIPLY